jgi:glyoxylase-like metal-dependent hydrolase (beta-lactamase superfamily II)
MAYSKLLNLRVVARDMVMHYTPTLIVSDSDLILVDCGTPGLIETLSEAIAMEGFKLHDLTKVIITHHDHDHYGSLAALKRLVPQIKVIASPIEAPYIEGREKSLRLQQAEALYDTLPTERKEWADWFHKYLASIEPVKVDVLANDGESVDIAGEVVIVATPGHMPGHISVYVKGDRTLVSGDALVSENGVLMMANPQYSLDLETARASARKLTELDIERIICYHGGLIEGNIKAALKEII